MFLASVFVKKCDGEKERERETGGRRCELKTIQNMDSILWFCLFVEAGGEVGEWVCRSKR